MKQENKGIWKYSDSFPPVAEKFQLTLGEGSTAIVKNNGIFFKCEFENPTGSVKDRGICFQTAKLKENGHKEAVISSSGNAAVSASFYCSLHQIKLSVYLSPDVNRAKLSAIKKGTDIIKTKKPISSAAIHSLEKRIPNLRPSTDPFGSAGYRTISFELAKKIPGIDAVFIPVSSGAALKGIYEGFAMLNLKPALHAVQTTRIHPLAGKFDKDFKFEASSLADAIVAKYLPLEQDLMKILLKTKGSAWVISNELMRENKNKLKKMDLNSSYEGAAVLAAVYKAHSFGFKYKFPVCILTGKEYPLNEKIS